MIRRAWIRLLFFARDAVIPTFAIKGGKIMVLDVGPVAAAGPPPKYHTLHR